MNTKYFFIFFSALTHSIQAMQLPEKNPDYYIKRAFDLKTKIKTFLLINKMFLSKEHKQQVKGMFPKLNEMIQRRIDFSQSPDKNDEETAASFEKNIKDLEDYIKEKFTITA